MKKALLLFLVACLGILPASALGYKLSGTLLKSGNGYDYSTGRSSTTTNTAEMAIDGNLDTYFASSSTSKGWVGLDLGKPYVISRFGWAPSTRDKGSANTMLGIVEGANKEDFSDALPLFMITEQAVAGRITYADLNGNTPYRYVRYKGPDAARCNIAEMEFWGYATTSEGSKYYQVTNLPTVVIHTEREVDPTNKEIEIPCLMTIISEDGRTISQHEATTRLRGNASMNFPKKPYRIKYTEKQHILDAPAKAKKWTLINNYGDKTLMRNILAFELSRRLGIGYTPWCKPVDVIFNGQYKGCYQLCDQIDVRKHRVDITEMDSTCTEGEALTGGYLIEIDAYASSEPRHFTTTRKTPVRVRYPDADEILTEQYKYIKAYYIAFEDQLYKAATWRDSLEGYRKYLNLPSFLRHFLVGEFSGNTDTYWSTYMYKDRNQTQFFVEPVWDSDLAFENDNRTYPICSTADYIYRTKGSHAGNFNTIVDRILVYDKEASQDLRDMWAFARRKQDINDESLLALVDSLAEVLQASQALNFIRWPIMNTLVHQNPKIWGSYEKEVKNVKDYIVRRLAWMDRKLKYNPDDYSDDTDYLYLSSHLRENVNVWDRHLLISGFPEGTPYTVYHLSGAMTLQGRSGAPSPQLLPGVYIVHIAGQSIKISVQ